MLLINAVTENEPEKVYNEHKISKTIMKYQSKLII